jgi:hypothetical protein
MFSRNINLADAEEFSTKVSIKYEINIKKNWHGKYISH